MVASTLRNISSSALQVLISAIALFGLYRFLLMLLGARDFGIWALIQAATSLIALSNMGLTSSIVKFVADNHADGDRRKIADLVETSAISVGFFSLFLSLVGYPLIRLYFEHTMDAEAYHLAAALLPWALAAFSLSMITGIYHSALYGCHLILERNELLIFDSLSYLALSMWIAPTTGLSGLIYARVVQNSLTLILSSHSLRQRVVGITFVPLRWKLPVFKELLGYAFTFQVIGILNIIMDPLTKGLLSRFGSLEMVTYFEMASRLIAQLRGILVNANQVLVPTFAKTSRSNPAGTITLFMRSYDAMFFISVCAFGLLLASLPLIGLLWLSTKQPLFVTFGMILAIGWFINTLSVPAYFACLGTGVLSVLLAAHSVMAVLNVVLGIGLGENYRGIGVVGAWALALAAGGVVSHIGFSRRIHISSKHWFPPRGLQLLAFAATGLMLGYFAMEAIEAHRHPVGHEPIALAAIPIAGFIIVMFLPVYRHPVRRELAGLLMRSRSD